ncbi:MAG TPA: VTT domain-containing protein [Candidatus Paceibacterota bacterium]|nr:VTT domain-containing protein [Candidatus Paceibacterota bacterium]
MFTTLEEMLLAYAHTLPLEVFAFVASFVEEIIAPIPSPTVMVVTGSFAQMQGYSVFGLLALILMGAFGKVIGAVVVYTIALRAEYFLMNTLGRFFNVSEEDVAKLGSKLGKGTKDYALLTFLRALPIMPSVVVSAGSGILKVSVPLFIVSTFLGTIIRDGFYIYAGYYGAHILQTLIISFGHIETYVEIAVVLFIVGFMARRLMKRSSRAQS